ncbi:MAG: hypothetical protein CMG21_00650 [Candidatus Marinimicrobia bacterium]|nr:hypothetical protein [Candidatus Neomarinimicrobiota bacterium]
MKLFFFYTLIFNFIFSFSMEEKDKFINSFNDDIDRAIEFIDSHRDKIIEISKDYGIDANIALSIMFPELVRYNHFKDQIEVSANKLFYIKWGPEYADFSIGILQMKPTFIERLSKTRKRDKYNDLFLYPENSSKEDVRGIIIDRLQDVEYQLKYLAYFINIIDTSNEVKFENNYDKITYYATAYNAGSWYNEDNNQKLSKKKTYPYGANNDEIKQYSYSDISLYYYQNILNK